MLSHRGPAQVGLTLEAKLHPPSLRPEWVERRRLIQRLTASTSKVVVLNACAGAGKTVLAAQWRASALDSRPFAWLSIDDRDNDPVRLWSHLAQAVLRACQGLRLTGTREALRAPVPDVMGSLLPALVSDLAALPGGTVLVLDNYGVIAERACHEQAGFLLDHVPRAVQLVLVSKTAPGLPLGRLRAAGDIDEIGMRELRFTPEEAAAVVRAVAQVELAERDLDRLLKRTEGWPAGVYLAGLSMRGHPSPSVFIRQFTGSNEYVADFLFQEVLAQQPRPVRHFLERTAILGHFTLPLCDAVVGSGNAAEVIEALERGNLFLVPLDGERQWFRYHRLFQQMLVGRLMQTEPALLPVLHARASAWYERMGRLDRAISHAVAADGSTRATSLIVANWATYATTGRTATVRSWLRSLGEDRIAASPVAAHCAAWVAALSGDRESLRKWLGVVEASKAGGPLPDGAISLEFSAALLRATCGFGGLRVALRSASKAATLADDPASAWYMGARAAYGWNLYLSGEPWKAQRVLREALRAQASFPLPRMLALATMSLVALDTGLVGQAESLAQTAAGLLGVGEIRRTPQSALAYTALASVHASQGHVAQARGELEKALRSRPKWFQTSPWVTVETQLRLAPVLFELGDDAAAAALVRQAGDVLGALPDGTEALRARLTRLERRFAAGRHAAPRADLLSERERAVLHLLRGSLSRREIGQRLHVSVNTVKTHTNAIYRKLGVRTREEAIERALYLDLI